MKVKIVEDEWTIYYIADADSDWGNICDVPDAVLQRWDRVQKAFNMMQKELKEFYLKGE